jgi:hypothetical protein
MNLHLLDLAIQNQIIMYQRPKYNYLAQLKHYHTIWDSKHCYREKLPFYFFIIDANLLHNYFLTEYSKRNVNQEWEKFLSSN